ncbi:MAG: lysine--tRNA ligase [Rhodospirillaceae bacterium]|jgi:lysyl-tRNA synthetase, class I|nr:lysine--tRNA ligase [Rhodospirillaceae bacterium]MBT5666433.1 lysine--tRNA ligase [Rhodospirillaceae bacterium]MBT5811914.1 lysine--tRNA ligase [Rhodospirillaceae bacterium]
MSSVRELALEAKAWPFAEARRILKRIGGKTPEKGYVLFETGYGPSGLPHIGTFGEVSRTTMVRRAFEQLSDIPTKLFAFSDDMDGFRSVPTNVPEQDMLAQNIGKPLTSVPDPFGTHDSFGAHNNARLREFLDRFGFEYEFLSATECYQSGRFDEALLTLLREYDAVQSIMLPSLGEERQQTYSPFLPVCPESGKVLQAPVVETNADAGTIVYRRDDDQLIETPVTGGRCKLQWKPDWAMRWFALGVDYEMSGKDLIDSVRLSGRITRALGGKPPESFTYELFLDENGEKISKSRGNGLTMEEWLTYAPGDSLSLFMFQKPNTAKRLHFDVIPKAVDEYFTFKEKFAKEDDAARLQNPVWHIHNGAPSADSTPISFNILLNLAGACNTEDKAVLWGFISRYAPDAAPESHPLLDDLVAYAIRYYQDFVKPTKQYRAPNDVERQAILSLVDALGALPDSADAKEIQNQVYEVGKKFEFDPLRDWFKALYEVLFGQDQGPRMGSFIALYGIEETIALMRRALEGEGLSTAS